MLGKCAWTLYDDNTRGILGVVLFVAGFCSVTLNGWLLGALLKTKLVKEPSMLTLLNLSVASFARSVVVGFVFAGLSAAFNRWLFGDMICVVFGFLSHFIGAYQIEALTHMSIERYVVAKYYKQGWDVTGHHYALFTGLCWMFSILYSIPMPFSLGSYDWDYTCTACTLNLILPKNTYQRYFTLIVFFLVSVKPVMIMAIMLFWTRQIEIKYYNQNEHGEQLKLTKSVISLTCVMLACWTPTAVAGAYVILSQLLLHTLLQPPLIMVFLASFGSEILPAMVVLVLLWRNETVRNAMFFRLDRCQHRKDS